MTTLELLLRQLDAREFLIEMKSGPAYYAEKDNLRKIQNAQRMIRNYLNK